MKRSVVVWVAVLATGLVASDTEREVQCEEFTATSCGYCPYAGEAFGALLNSYPTTFAGIQIHLGDAYATSWGTARDTFYNVTGTPTAWFDGLISRVGGTSGMTYTSEYNKPATTFERHQNAGRRGRNHPPTSPPTYEVQIKLTLEPTARPNRARLGRTGARLLPDSPSYSRNCLRTRPRPRTWPCSPAKPCWYKTLQIDTASAANPKRHDADRLAQAPNSAHRPRFTRRRLMNYPSRRCTRSDHAGGGGAEFIPQ